MWHKIKWHNGQFTSDLQNWNLTATTQQLGYPNVSLDNSRTFIPLRVHSSRLGVIIYPPQGGTEKSNLLRQTSIIRARQICLKECRLSLPVSFPGLFHVINFKLRFLRKYFEKNVIFVMLYVIFVML